MAEYNKTFDVAGDYPRMVGDGGGTGGGFFGGNGLMCILGLGFLWMLFKGDRHHGSDHGGHRDSGYRNWQPDEGNYEMETKLIRDQNDHDIRQTANSAKILERLHDDKVQDLRDKNTEQRIVISEMRNEMFTTQSLAPLHAALAAIGCKLGDLVPEPRYLATRGQCLNMTPDCGPQRGNIGCGFND